MIQPTLQPTWYADQLLPHPDGDGFCIKQPNGAYVSWLHDGSLEEQPNGAFDQERIRKASLQPSTAYTLYLADRTSYPEGRCYFVIIVPR